MNVRLDFISDVVCPWCWVGLRNAKTAIDTLAPQIQVQTIFHPFFLDHGIPMAGVEYQAFMEQKFPDKAVRATGLQHLTEAGAQVDIDFRFDKITRRPNTRDAHRLIHWAQGQGKGWEVKEALFMAFFTLGEDVGNSAILTQIGSQIGMDGAIVADLLASERDVEQVEQQAVEAQHIGVGAVPTFIVAQKRGVSGAQAPQTLEKLLREGAQGV